MAASAERVPLETVDDTLEPVMHTEGVADLAGLMLDRISHLYAEQERAERVERTARMIRAAEDLQ